MRVGATSVGYSSKWCQTAYFTGDDPCQAARIMSLQDLEAKTKYLGSEKPHLAPLVVVEEDDIANIEWVDDK